jgi:hypothetical protein
MVEACRTHTEFWLEKLKEREHLEDLDANGKIILKCIFKKLNRERVIYSPHLEGRDMWRVFINAVMNLRVP